MTDDFSELKKYINSQLEKLREESIIAGLGIQKMEVTYFITKYTDALEVIDEFLKTKKRNW